MVCDSVVWNKFPHKSVTTAGWLEPVQMNNNFCGAHSPRWPATRSHAEWVLRHHLAGPNQRTAPPANQPVGGNACSLKAYIIEHHEKLEVSEADTMDWPNWTQWTGRAPKSAE